MHTLRITLFGQFHLQVGDHALTTLKNRRVQELFAYLLLHRGQPHHRESLASILWEDASPTQAKSYLRKTLWQLQSALNELDPSLGADVLQVTDEWIRIHLAAPIDLDVAQFEGVFAATQGIPQQALDPSAMRALAGAVELYQGSLLEGCYLDWCLFERERLQQLYFVMLDKLIDGCEAHQEWERGLIYGALSLRLDIARERTHRRMMRLHLLARDRTAAIRQFERCREALQTELGVAPSRQTLALYRQICHDEVEPRRPGPAVAPSPASPAVLVELAELNDALVQVRDQVDDQIKVIEALLHAAPPGPHPSLPVPPGEPRFHPGAP
jgi:DNA-binding SARP family transcriptional activator